MCRWCLLLTLLLMTLFDLQGVRRRNRPKREIGEKEESESTGSEKAPAGKHDQNPQQDPLKWFGVLVPQSLKHAQSSFKQGMLHAKGHLSVMVSGETYSASTMDEIILSMSANRLGSAVIWDGNFMIGWWARGSVRMQRNYLILHMCPSWLTSQKYNRNHVE